MDNLKGVSNNPESITSSIDEIIDAWSGISHNLLEVAEDLNFLKNLTDDFEYSGYSVVKIIKALSTVKSKSKLSDLSFSKHIIGVCSFEVMVHNINRVKGLSDKGKSRLKTLKDIFDLKSKVVSGYDLTISRISSINGHIISHMLINRPDMVNSFGYCGKLPFHFRHPHAASLMKYAEVNKLGSFDWIAEYENFLIEMTKTINSKMDDVAVKNIIKVTLRLTKDQMSSPLLTKITNNHLVSHRVNSEFWKALDNDQ